MLGEGMTLVNDTCNDNPNNTQYTPQLNACAVPNGNGCCVDLTYYRVSECNSLPACKSLSAYFQLTAASPFADSSTSDEALPGGML